MAGTWTVKISNVNKVKKSADISFTRLDDETGETESYNFSQAIIDTNAQKGAILNDVWNKHLEAVAEKDAINTFIADLETAAKTNLEARES